MLLVVGGENLGMKFFAPVFDLNLKISKKKSHPWLFQSDQSIRKKKHYNVITQRYKHFNKLRSRSNS